MVKYCSPALDAVFSALADPTRRAILAHLAHSDASVTRLAARFEMSLPAVSKHLRVLERASLLTSRKTGRVRRCRLVAGPMRDAAEWIGFYRRFWEEQLDSLARYLEQTNEKEENTCPSLNRPLKTPSRCVARSPRRRKESSKPGPGPKR